MKAVITYANQQALTDLVVFALIGYITTMLLMNASETSMYYVLGTLLSWLALVLITAEEAVGFGVFLLAAAAVSVGYANARR